MLTPVPLPTRASRARVAGLCMIVGGLGVLTACGVLRANAAAPLSPQAASHAVSQVTGWTKAVMTPHYLVVVNVLPSEPMMTMSEMQMNHPTEGELIIDGKGNAQGEAVRHVEAHVYDRATGKALTGTVPTIKLINRTTGESVTVEPTLMQDVVIGPLDLHFGNNVLVQGDSDISVHVTVSGEEVSIDGHLD